MGGRPPSYLLVFFPKKRKEKGREKMRRRMGVKKRKGNLCDKRKNSPSLS